MENDTVESKEASSKDPKQIVILKKSLVNQPQVFKINDSKGIMNVKITFTDNFKEVKKQKIMDTSTTTSTITCIQGMTDNQKEELCLAIESGDNIKAQKLIELLNHIDEIIGYYGSCLSHASYFGNIEMIKYSLENGANLHQPDLNGDVALTHAKNIEISELLLNAGADVNYINKHFSSAILHASHFKRLDIIKLLVFHGIDMNICGGFALYCAAGYGHYNSVKLLVDCGANINFSQKEDGWTPLHFSSANGRLEIIELLIENGADGNIKNKEGKTAQQVAKNDKIKEFIKMKIIKLN